MHDGTKETVCKVCGDKASGKHYGVPSCDGCRGFFKRSIRRNLDYVCKEGGRCVVDVTRRNQCQACRFSKCLEVNMKKDAVQHERSPRNTLPSGCSPLHTPPVPTTLPIHLYHHPHHYVPAFSYVSHPAISGLYDYPTVGFRSVEGAVTVASSPVITATSSSSSSCNENEVSSSQESIEPAKFGSVAVLPSEDTYTMSSRLLALAVQCVNVIPSFQHLAVDDRETLLEVAWKDLFVLTWAQWSLPLEEDKILDAVKNESSFKKLKCDLLTMHSAVAKLSQLRTDHTEYACLKALVIFNPESVRKHEVELLQEQTHLMLAEYSNSVRAARLVLVLVAISRISLQSILKLFFRSDSPSETLRSLLEKDLM